MQDTSGKFGRFSAGLRSANRFLDLTIEIVTSSLLVIIVGINASEIFTRLFFDNSLTWVFEINLLLANWLYFLGISLVYYRRNDIVVEFLYVKFFLTLQRRFLVLIHALTIGVLSVLVWYSIPLILLQSETSSSGLHIPNHWFSMPVMIGAIAMIMYVFADMAGAGFDSETERKLP